MKTNSSKPYKYGAIVCETDSFDFVKSEQDRLIEYHGYKCGDIPEYLNTTIVNCAYVLVINDEFFADVEYRIKDSGLIVTRSELKDGIIRKKAII